MKLYFIRHAPAEFRHIFAMTGQPDDLRPLTDKGIQRMQSMLKFLKKIEESVDVILHSPLTRCLQTAEICQSTYPEAQLVSTKNLSPDHSAKKLYNEIINYDVDSVVIVGHEPDLGQFLSWLLFRQATDHFPFKKAGIAKVDIYASGRSYLKWIVRPKMVISST